MGAGQGCSISSALSEPTRPPPAPTSAPTDDGPAGQDMGRRKLPSLPSQPAYSTTATYPAPPVGAYEPPRNIGITRQTQQAPIYLSSSAPSSHVSTSSTQTLNGHLPPERPSSTMSWTSQASTSSLHEAPTIIPGASFAKPKVALRKPVSSVVGSKIAHRSRIPTSLARVILKKELKQALEKRMESLEACEIEANQREYVVHKMLVTGLLPEAREDDIPSVIPCLLPIELIAGAQVMPKETCTVGTQKSDDDTVPPEPRRTVTSIPAEPTRRTQSTVGVQSQPIPSLRQQIGVERRQRGVTTETQTDSTSLPYCRTTYFEPVSSTRYESKRERHDATAQTTDLLEATKKYFEDYDRQLKEISQRSTRPRRRKDFVFHDDDALSREQRRMQLSEELARRRELLTSRLDLQSDPYRGTLGGSDYSTVVPHYGSLSRVDYPRTTSMTRDYTARDQYSYGSLPRNYERCLGNEMEPIRIEYEQSFGAPRYRSLGNLASDYDYRLHPAAPPQRAVSYMDDYALYREPRYDTYQPDMVSQYANYLNNQFGLLTMADRSATLPPLSRREIRPVYEYVPPPPPLSDPTRQFAEVYSRNETNYGSRPAVYPSDYGNRGRYATWNGNFAQSREDPLSRVLATAGRRQPEVNNNASNYPSAYAANLTPGSATKQRQYKRSDVRVQSPVCTKRLLLTRRYKDHNIYNDLGLRVTGGKRMPNGELCAFVSAVNMSRFSQTLCEIKEGDLVLEWNGVLLNGKTFEEVERIVNSSAGEVDVVIRTGISSDSRKDLSPDRPPVPMHRTNSSKQNVYDAVDVGRRSDGGLGNLQIAMSYDHRQSRLSVQILSARGLKMRDSARRCPPNPFVKVYLLPGRKVSHKRRTRFVPSSTNPDWNQMVSYDVPSTALHEHFIELSIWDYDKLSENNSLGRVVIPLRGSVLSGVPRWYPIETFDVRAARAHHVTLAEPFDNSEPGLLQIGYPAIN